VAKAARVHQCDVTFAISGDDFFFAAAHLFGQIRKFCSDLVNRNYVVAVKCQAIIH
jgi:hypothetical protein